jgi:Na+-translocating ferredoxin:NAD+ oxidoreductase RNF subunit RnfB
MQGIIVLTLTAFILGIIIVLIDSKLNTKDNSVEEIEKYLPGINCGACGYGTCHNMACKIKEDYNEYKKCRVLRGEKLQKFLDNVKEK